MNFDEEFKQVITAMTLEELEATKTTLEQAYAKVNHLIAEKTSVKTSSTTVDHCRQFFTEVGDQPKCPVLCEPALETQVVGLSPQERRNLAWVYARWAQQLFFSADLIDRIECRPGKPMTLKAAHRRKLERVTKLQREAEVKRVRVLIELGVGDIPSKPSLLQAYN